MSATESFQFFEGQDIWEYFKDGRAILEAPVIQDVLDYNFYMGYHGVPKMPMLISRHS